MYHCLYLSHIQRAENTNMGEKVKENSPVSLNKLAQKRTTVTSMQDQEVILMSPDCYLSQGCDIMIENSIFKLYFCFTYIGVCLHVTACSTGRYPGTGVTRDG